MSSLDELTAQVQASVQAVNEASNQVQAARTACEELAGNFSALGNQSVPGLLAEAKSKLDEAIAQAAGQVKLLEEAQSQIQAAKSS